MNPLVGRGWSGARLEGSVAASGGHVVNLPGGGAFTGKALGGAAGRRGGTKPAATSRKAGGERWRRHARRAR